MQPKPADVVGRFDICARMRKIGLNEMHKPTQRDAVKTDFVAATDRYEAWLRSLVEIQQDELDYKHVQMAAKDGAFPFFRGTYYRWAEIWPEFCVGCQSAPSVLAVGDLHVENFGTWRDREGRLVWGINDFDEVDDLPFTNDLVRLAASASVGADKADFRLGLKQVCGAILSGYVAQLKRGGQPFVLEEDHLQMRDLATHADRDPVVFWKKLTAVLKDPPAHVSAEIETALKRDLQGSVVSSEIRARRYVGMGSLGKPRYVALANFMGAWVAREAKAVTPPATAFLDSKRPNISRVTEVLSRAVRCADPILRVDGKWIVRRLAPRCSRIELALLTRIEDETLMFESMGAETANIHCGTPEASEPILHWLESQDSEWLANAARIMIDATCDDWKTWRKAHRDAPTNSP